MSLKTDMRNVVVGPNDATNFSTQLIRLIFKADVTNKVKLFTVFPNAVRMVTKFQQDGVILDLPYD